MTIINSQLGGTKPTGTKQINTNGTHDVAGYANADVQVPTTAPAYYDEKTKDSNNILQNGQGMNTFAGVKDIGPFVCSDMYRSVGNGNNNKVITVDMSDIISLSKDNSCENMFFGQRSTGVNNYTEINVDLSHLVSITGQNACYQIFSAPLSTNNFAKLNVNLNSLQTINATNACSNMFAFFSTINGYLIDFSFPSLKTISGSRSCINMFQGNNIIKKLSFPELETISGPNCVNSFAKDSYSLKECSFDKLNTISVQMGGSGNAVFGGCNYIEKVSFGGLKASTFSSIQNQFQYLFNTASGQYAPNGCTIHFPSNFDPSDPNHTFDASTLTGYPTFGGSASYIHVAFDLPATE